MPNYDIIIVGAGIAGLYSAHRILKQSPDLSILILESGAKSDIGGRMGNDQFYGVSVVKGAGIGRKKTDVILAALLKEFDVEYNEFVIDHKFSPKIQDQVVDVNKTVAFLRKIYKQNSIKQQQKFKEFAVEHLGERMYNQFVLSTGYTDYEDADVYSVLYLYQMDNNTSGWTAYHIPWSDLVDKLKQRLGSHRIKTGQQVSSIQYRDCNFEVVANTGSSNKQNVFRAKKVIVATSIDTVKRLFTGMPVYRQIQGQPFLYVYAKFNKESAALLKTLVPTYTLVEPPLQKIIPMDADKGVYMIAYADNHNATRLKPYLDNTRESNKRYFERQMERVLGLNGSTLSIIAFTSYYWKIGTHYLEPHDTRNYRNLQQMLDLAQHPVPGILVVGEAVSAHQGWTEGALESVDRVLTRDWIQHPGF
jgi:hypothetical protein